MAYEHDVFISYRRGNETYRRWVPGTFFQPFKDYLSEALPHDANIFWDIDGIHAGDQWENRLYEKITRSKVLIPILIPSYFRSDWCRREFAAFYHRQRQLKLSPGGLILPVVLQDTTYPDYVQGIQGFPCERYSIVPLNPLTETYEAFHLDLKRWVKNVSQAIDRAPEWRAEWMDYDQWIEKPFQELIAPSPRMDKAPQL